MIDREFFVHLTVGDGGATLSCKLRGGGDLVDVGVAFCAPVEQFSRKRGRIIATGRRECMGDPLRNYRATQAFAFRLDGETMPLRDQAVKAFRDWLANNGARPLWTIDADEPRVALRGAQ